MIRAKNRDGRIIHISETSAHRPRSVTGWVADKMMAATAANNNKMPMNKGRVICQKTSRWCSACVLGLRSGYTGTILECPSCPYCSIIYFGFLHCALPHNLKEQDAGGNGSIQALAATRHGDMHLHISQGYCLGSCPGCFPSHDERQGSAKIHLGVGDTS